MFHLNLTVYHILCLNRHYTFLLMATMMMMMIQLAY